MTTTIKHSVLVWTCDNRKRQQQQSKERREQQSTRGRYYGTVVVVIEWLTGWRGTGAGRGSAGARGTTCRARNKHCGITSGGVIRRSWPRTRQSPGPWHGAMSAARVNPTTPTTLTYHTDEQHPRHSLTDKGEIDWFEENSRVMESRAPPYVAVSTFPQSV